MEIVKRINNNAVLCRDSRGREVVAFGRGIGFSKVGETAPLSKVERTFYDVDDRLLALMSELSPEVLSLASELIDIARSELPYELGRGAELALADHISFAIERERQHIKVQMPLSAEMERAYPVEYRIGVLARRRIREVCGVDLPEDEASGIAMSLVNRAYSAKARAADSDSFRDAETIERVTSCMERRLHITVDAAGFDGARFLSHLRYLLGRIREGGAASEQDAKMYEMLAVEFPQVAACVDEMSGIISEALGLPVSKGERFYLLLHASRLMQRSR